MTRQTIFIFLSVICFMSGHAETPEVASDTTSVELNEIVVKNKNDITRLEGSSLISVIPGTPLENIGTALDALRQLPMITVDENTLSIIGKGTPEIYIDGHPMRTDDELIILRSNQIRKVELLLSPGAKYSASTKAVLKITTRKSFIDGLSTTTRTSASFKRKISADELIDLNYRTGFWDFFATGAFAHNNELIKGTTINTLIYDGQPTTIGSTQRNTYPSNNAGIKTGLNFSSGDLSAGAYYRYHPERGDFENNGSEWFDNQNPISRIISHKIRAHSHLASAYYDNTFGNKYHAHADLTFKSSISSKDVNTSYPGKTNRDVNSSDDDKTNFAAAKAYVDFPAGKSTLTFGAEGAYTKTSLDYRMLNDEIGVYLPSSLTSTLQKKAALFASWGTDIGKATLNAGLRYEYSDFSYSINKTRDENISGTDNYLTPDLSFTYAFNNTAQLSLSYRASTVRPPYSSLKGSLNYVGIHEIEGGNPGLKDERMHDVGLFFTWKDFILQADCMRSLDTYAFIKRVYPASDIQLLLQPVNIDVSSIDIYAMWNKTIKKWRTGLIAGMYKQWLNLHGERYNKPLFSYYFDNTFSFSDNVSASINIHGQGQGFIHTNCFRDNWFVADATVSANFLNKTLNINLSATDIFGTMRNDWSMTTYGVTVDKRQSYGHRGVTLSLTYSFHPIKSKYRGENASESELKRL